MTPEQEEELSTLLGRLVGAPSCERQNDCCVTIHDFVSRCIQQAEDAAFDAARSVYLKSEWPMGAQHEVPVYETIDDWRKSRKLEGGV